MVSDTKLNYKKIEGFSDSNSVGVLPDGTLIYITEKKNWAQVLKHGLPVNLLYQNIDVVNIVDLEKVEVHENQVVIQKDDEEDVIDEDDEEEEDLNTDDSDDLIVPLKSKKSKSKTILSSEKQKDKTLRSRLQKIIRPKELKPVCFEDSKCLCTECNINILEDKKKLYEKYKELYTCYTCQKYNFGLQLNQCFTPMKTSQNIVFNDCIFLCDDCFYIKSCTKHFFYPTEKCEECYCGCCGEKNENLVECRNGDSFINVCYDCRSSECCMSCDEFCGSGLCKYCRSG